MRVMQFLEFHTVMEGATGGTETHLFTLSEQLARREVDLSLACFPPKPGSEFQRRASDLGLPIHPFPVRGRDALSYLRRTLWLAGLLRRTGTELLHVHTGGYMVTSALVGGALAGVPVVITHNSWFGPRPYSRASTVGLALERRLVARAIAVYGEQGRELASAGIAPERVRVVPYGIDMGRFRPGENRGLAEDGTLRMVIVARMEEGKGHRELVEALARIAPRHPHLRLLMVGDGPSRPGIQALVARLGLGSVVEAAGWVANDRLPDLLRSCQVTLLPSYWPGEAFPITLLEGMAMRLAAVGARWKGIGEMIVDGESGLVVEPRDVEGLAGALDRLAGDPALVARMGRAARERAKCLYSAEVMAETVVGIYREVLGVPDMIQTAGGRHGA